MRQSLQIINNELSILEHWWLNSSYSTNTGPPCSVQYDVRLVNGTGTLNSSSEGRIELCYNQKWRTICQSSYSYYSSSERLAATLCNQLGLTATSCKFSSHSIIFYLMRLLKS